MSWASTSTLTPWVALPLLVARQVLAQRGEPADVVPGDRQPDGDHVGAALAQGDRLHHRVVDADLEQRRVDLGEPVGCAGELGDRGVGLGLQRLELVAAACAARQTNMPEFHQYSPEAR